MKKFKKSLTAVGGIIFLHEKADHYGVHAWVEAGAPDNCYVSDTAPNLRYAGFPLSDAHEHVGILLRTELRQLEPAVIQFRGAPPELHKPVVSETVDEIAPVRANGGKWTYHGVRPDDVEKDGP